MSTVTAIILARNEEKHIVDCIKIGHNNDALVFHKPRVNGFYLLTLMSVYHQS